MVGVGYTSGSKVRASASMGLCGDCQVIKYKFLFLSRKKVRALRSLSFLSLNFLLASFYPRPLLGVDGVLGISEGRGASAPESL